MEIANPEAMRGQSHGEHRQSQHPTADKIRSMLFYMDGITKPMSCLQDGTEFAT